MKKVILSAAIILGGLSTFSTQAQEANPAEEVVAEVQEVQEEFKEVKVEDLPQPVKDALAADFKEATLTKASVNAKEEYKLEISVEGNAYAVYADKEGNWIEKK